MGADPKAPAAEAPTSWTWPHPPLSDRYNSTVTEVMDLASDGRRGTVSRVELVLGFRTSARVLIWADLVREPA